MKTALKNDRISLMHILIDFFASIYDLVYDSIVFILKTVMKLILKIKKSGLLNISIAFFASLYDLVYDFIVFLRDYVKWATDFHSVKSPDLTKPAEEKIRIHNQNPFDIR